MSFSEELFEIISFEEILNLRCTEFVTCLILFHTSYNLCFLRKINIPILAVIWNLHSWLIKDILEVSLVM